MLVVSKICLVVTEQLPCRAPDSMHVLLAAGVLFNNTAAATVLHKACKSTAISISTQGHPKAQPQASNLLI